MKNLTFLFITLALIFILPKYVTFAQQPAEDAAQQITNPIPGNALSQCQFSRGDVGTASFKSPKLLSYFEEAGKASSMPPELLAAFARVESPSSVNLTDSDLDNYKCAVSPTGARGLMQIQPPGTTGHDPAAIANGAKYLNRSVEELTIADYCDVRTSIFLSAGFIIKKLEYVGIKNNGLWNPEWTTNKDVINAAASGYYGCLLYPSCNSGPHSYGGDLWNSLQACKNPILSGATFSQSTTTAPPANISSSCTKVGNPLGESPCLTQSTGTTPTTNLGTGERGNFVYYCQGDSKWQGNSCNLGQVGCGPTSLAMIFTYFGNTITPADMLNNYTSNSLISCSEGSYPDRVVGWIRQQGYEVGPNIGQGILDAKLAKEYIDKGYLILGSSHEFVGQTGSQFSHIFVVQDVDPGSGTFIMRDPENCKYGSGEELVKNNIQPIKSTKIKSWAYAYPIIKPINFRPKTTNTIDTR